MPLSGLRPHEGTWACAELSVCRIQCWEMPPVLVQQVLLGPEQGRQVWPHPAPGTLGPISLMSKGLLVRDGRWAGMGIFCTLTHLPAPRDLPALLTCPVYFQGP